MTTETATANPGTTPTDTTGLGGVLAGLRRVHASGRTKAIEWRIRQLEGVVRFCEEREAEVAAALEADLGRDAFMSWFADVAPSKTEAEFAIKHLKGWMKPQKVKVPMTQQPGSARVQYEPLGVVLVIGPWNYPVQLSLSPIVSAVAAGNCVVLKPSEVAPATSAMLADLLPKYLDPEAIAVVEGDGVTTQELLALGFDHALFTGGTEIGKKIMAGAAATLTPVTLELGGKSPVIVAADADLGVVARRIALIKTMNSGQTCIAPDYVLVEEPVKDRLIAELRTAAAKQRKGEADGLRIVNQRQFDRLAGYLTTTQGRVVMGGGSDASSLRMDLTVLLDPAPDEPVMTEEIFGPILPVIGVGDVDEAIAFVNARPKPLACYVFTNDYALADSVVEAIPAGGAVVNHMAMHCITPTLPFGGVGPSGTGAYHGEWGFQALSHRKAVLVQRQKPDLKMIYPPYGRTAKKLLRTLF